MLQEEYIRQLSKTDIKSIDLDNLTLSDTLTYVLFPAAAYLELRVMLDESNQKEEAERIKIFTYNKIKDNIPIDIYEKLNIDDYRYLHMPDYICRKPSVIVSHFKKTDIEAILTDIMNYTGR